MARRKMQRPYRIKPPPISKEMRREIRVHNFKATGPARSSARPFKARATIRLAVEVPWIAASDVFGDHMRSLRHPLDKTIRTGRRQWAGDLLAVFRDSPDMRRAIAALGIRQRYAYGRIKPEGEHFIFFKRPHGIGYFPGMFGAGPDASMLTRLIRSRIPLEDIDYFIGLKQVRRKCNLAWPGLPGGLESAVFPLILAKSPKKGRIVRPALCGDAAEVVADYRIMVRHWRLAGRTHAIGKEELDALRRGPVPDALRAVPPEALYHLRRVADALSHARHSISLVIRGGPAPGTNAVVSSNNPSGAFHQVWDP